MSVLRGFAADISPFKPNDTLSVVADAFLHPDYRHCLSVAVVDEQGRPVGMISRHQLTDIFLKKFGRDLFGSRPIVDFMRHDVLAVAVDSSLAAAASFITAHMIFP